MALPIEKGNEENIDLIQMEYFSDVPISDKEVVVIESNNSIGITIRKFLSDLGFENIYICKEVKKGLETFYHFLGDDLNVPIIIDTSSDKYIEKTTNEILQVQPSAKIIITTTKESNDSQIAKLVDLGITSIIQKPIEFEHVKKAFSFLQLEKQPPKEDPISEKEEKKSTENYDKRKQIDEFLLSFKEITESKLKNILENVLKISQPELQSKIRELKEQGKLIEQKEILEAVCNRCNSSNITYSSECPKCGGINFSQVELIEHYSCGKIYPKGNNSNNCPECGKEMGMPGTDYREIPESYVCSSCSEKFPQPHSKFTCFDCENEFLSTLVKRVKTKVYKIQK